MSQQELFPKSEIEVNIHNALSPSGYKGLAAFHKYWGKKPLECLTFLIQKLSSKNDIVLDPFLGSGLVAKESLDLQRRFIGIDINPLSKDLATFFVNLPPYKEYHEAFTCIEKEVKHTIEQSYKLHDGRIATHYLWKNDELLSVWTRNGQIKTRIELEPISYDLNRLKEFSHYTSQHIRQPVFFDNSRVNSTHHLTLHDLFTEKALRNIDVILDAIHRCPNSLQKSLLLTLTSSVGQMSKMVFAISRRNKTKHNTRRNERVEVGSWVIGYWRPELHFEINVWNCFELRAKKLLKILKEHPGDTKCIPITTNPNEVLTGKHTISLVTGNCNCILETLEKGAISLIITDPPHSDRIPYLELSELWNAILQHQPYFDQEIVVSNAKERNKGKQEYVNDMLEFMQHSSNILKSGGFLAIIFNARDTLSWTYLQHIKQRAPRLRYLGCFPMKYSAGSVVQDNRKGALKNDFILVYQKVPDNGSDRSACMLESIRGWQTTFPKS